ncbi:hypothetical protein Tco_0879590 [Tanacetum coccineum]
MDYATEGRLRKIKEGSLDYENPDLEQLLRVMKCKVGTLMEKAISLIGRSESVFWISSKMMHRIPPEPSHQEAFEGPTMSKCARSGKSTRGQSSRIARSFGLLTVAMVDALSVEPQAYVFKKKSLIAMGVLIDLVGETYCWPVTRQIGDDDEVEEAANEEAGGSADIYRNLT